MERACTASCAWFCWVWLHKQVGWRLDPEKSPLPAGVWKLLGAELSVDVPRPVARLPDQKATALICDIDYYLQCCRLPAAEAGSLRGRLGWARSFLFGRYGSAALVPLRRRQFDGSGRTGMPASLSAALRWFRHAVHEQSGREVPFDLQSWPLVVTVSDGEGTGRVAAGIWKPRDPDFQPMLTATAVPEPWMMRWLVYT